MANSGKEEQTRGDDDHWAYYRSVQLTPAEKAAARAELRKKLDAPETVAAYETLEKLIGKIDIGSYDIDELREDRD